MAPDRTRVAVVVVLVCAFGVVAATVGTGTIPEGGGEGEPPDLDLTLDLLTITDAQSDGNLCPAALDEPLGLAATLAALGIGMVAGYRYLGTAPPVVVVGVPPALWSVGCSATVDSIPILSWLDGAALSPSLLFAAIVLGLCGVVGFLWLTTEADPPPVEHHRMDPDGPVDVDAVAGAAGRAAARMAAQADVENEVYRAWLEMTDHLGATRPETTTPAEFERLAIDAGMRENDVAELTRLFTDVRYGERPLAGREDRAVAALERIERRYGTGDR